MKNKPRFEIRNMIFILIGLLILFIMIQRIGAQNIYSIMYDIYSTHPEILFGCFFLFLFANVLRLIRWSILYSDASSINAFKIWMIGQAVNEVAPIGTGEVTRAYFAKKYFKIKIRKTLVAIVIERTSDVTFLGVMAVACTILLLSGTSMIPIIVIIFILLGIVYSILYYPANLDHFRVVLKWLRKRKSRFFNNLGKKGEYWLKGLKSSLMVQRERKNIILISIVFTIFIWSVEAVGYYLLLDSVGYEIEYYYVLIIISASWIIGALSFLPGGIGARELTFAFLMTTLGVPEVESMTIALIYRGIAYLILGSGSMISILTLPKRDKGTQ